MLLRARCPVSKILNREKGRRLGCRGKQACFILVLSAGGQVDLCDKLLLFEIVGTEHLGD